jgi:hypothetical protein
MKRTTIAIALALALPLGGCLTVAEQIDETCRGYGFTPNTPDFARCRMTVDQQWANQQQAALNSLNNSGPVMCTTGPLGVIC